MTREEATAYWKQRSEHIHNWLEENEDADFVGEYVEAIDMAIESLSADTVSRSQYQGLLNAIGKVYVEVVRCKDCKNNYNTCTNHGINQPMCDFTDRMLKETDFCSRGERREE